MRRRAGQPSCSPLRNPHGTHPPTPSVVLNWCSSLRQAMRSSVSSGSSALYGRPALRLWVHVPCGYGGQAGRQGAARSRSHTGVCPALCPAHRPAAAACATSRPRAPAPGSRACGRAESWPEWAGRRATGEACSSCCSGGSQAAAAAAAQAGRRGALVCHRNGSAMRAHAPVASCLCCPVARGQTCARGRRSLVAWRFADARSTRTASRSQDGAG